jgi:hypothetical protein
MSASATAAAAPANDSVTPAELHLGKTLALIHRILPRLDDGSQADAVQTALAHAAEELAAARAAHQRMVSADRSAATESELLAIIAAAVAVVLQRPHRVVSVKPAGPVVTWVNAWAMEGRFQHYSSHKVR